MGSRWMVVYRGLSDGVCRRLIRLRRSQLDENVCQNYNRGVGQPESDWMLRLRGEWGCSLGPNMRS